MIEIFLNTTIILFVISIILIIMNVFRCKLYIYLLTKRFFKLCFKYLLVFFSLVLAIFLIKSVTSPLPLLDSITYAIKQKIHYEEPTKLKEVIIGNAMMPVPNTYRTSDCHLQGGLHGTTSSPT